MQIETLIDVDMLIVDQGLHSWMFFFSVGEGRLYLSNANDKCRPHSCLYIYIYIYIEEEENIYSEHKEFIDL